MATDILSLLSEVPALKALFTGSTTAPYQQQQEQLAGRQNDISKALTEGQNNPLYQQLYGQYQQQNHNNLAQTIAESQAQNRLNTRMGRTPLFSNERGGETAFRALTQGYQNSGVQSDQQTRQALSQAGGQTLGGLQGYNSINNTTAGANKGQLLGYQGIYDLFRGNNPNLAQSTATLPANYASQMQIPQQTSTGSMGAGNYSLAGQGYGQSQGYGMGLYNPQQGY